jgi:F0F1-type ATP synthase assembly protein I
MNQAQHDNKQRDRKIAANESERTAGSAIRLSGWAIGLAVLVGLVLFGWLFRS